MSLSWERLHCLLALENMSRWSWEKKTSKKFLLEWESAVCSKTTQYYREFLYLTRYCSQDKKIVISVMETEYFVYVGVIPGHTVPQFHDSRLFVALFSDQQMILQNVLLYSSNSVVKTIGAIANILLVHYKLIPELIK